MKSLGPITGVTLYTIISSGYPGTLTSLVGAFINRFDCSMTNDMYIKRSLEILDFLYTDDSSDLQNI